MTWQWSDGAGEMRHDGEKIGSGYSGSDWGKNNPQAVAAPGVGPIPLGSWTMTGIESGGPTGPFTIILAPDAGTDTHGRSQFRVHGDSIANPGHASHGCIIISRPTREAMWRSGDPHLQVVA
jgi:hypothetical protein